MITQADRTGLSVSIAGHVALFGALSLGMLAATRPTMPSAPPIDVQIVDEVGLTDTAPVPPKVAPAQSVAPVMGPPKEAAPTPVPELVPTKPTPTPVEREAVAPPRAVPKQAPKPAAVAKAARNPPAPARMAAAPSKSAAKPSATSARGSKLGSDFLKGISDRPSASTSQAPRVTTVGPAQLAGLAAAIRNQVQPCADRIATPGPGAERIVTKINLRMRRDGSFAASPDIVSQITDDDNARYAGRVAELARAAFVQCSPFALPAELYDGWKNINLNYKLPG